MVAIPTSNPTSNPTDINVQEAIAKQRAFFATGKTKSYDFRVAQLQKLLDIIQKNDQLILDALHADLRKPAIEAYGSEVLGTLSEIKYAIKHLKSWMKPLKVGTPINLFPSSSYIYTEPLGVVLIIAPWNYPFVLTIQPLIGAIAAGNCAILKPSENTPNTSKAIAKIINENFDPNFVLAIEGGIETNQALLTEKFDHIFFTGGTAIGKIVMEAAAKHLTPVTLELGGKSPCIIDSDCDLDIAAKRIIWGKFYNAGQTCVAPDYLLIQKKIKPILIEKLVAYVKTFFGDHPQQTPDFGRIVNDRQFDRLFNLIDQSKSESKILIGGQSDKGDRFIAPTLIDEVSPNSKIMAEEIFGPILPILEYDQFSEAIAFVNAQPKPLALYLFSNNKQNQERILQEVSFGGGCFNDAIMHLANPELPFGGVGDSGMGGYHGKASFDTFSHRKSVLKNSFRFDLKWRYPPYTMSLDSLKKFIK
ncbi:aldehyde dehydrogenase [Pseudanabaena sp. FACHB-1998]|uniref:aldehyde dehydrogenase n=1 Tax=Pseudanabaena sp. FACHB-1998 TaxID=2692858 RepID=UPI00167FE3EE|nr:aldehyde dehydrogenase [Pseudanabaena sp. FACHB-1998]MBD2177172.1 aldehyde dehydrogenase [Pseudanabaena sp. FACHB-1998]